MATLTRSSSSATPGYTVRQNVFGLWVTGSIPVSELQGLAVMWQSLYGLKFMRADIAEALEATIALVKDDAAGKEWLASLGIRADHPDWLRSGDVGLSSKTIFATFMDRWDILGDHRHGYAPADSDDFGRCHRLLLRYPEWRRDLHKVAEKCPAFAPLVPIWSELDALFVEKRYVELNKMIRTATQTKP